MRSVKGTHLTAVTFASVHYFRSCYSRERLIVPIISSVVCVYLFEKLDHRLGPVIRNKCEANICSLLSCGERAMRLNVACERIVAPLWSLWVDGTIQFCDRTGNRIMVTENAVLAFVTILRRYTNVPRPV